MLEKKGNGGEFEWKIMVEPHLQFVSCLCFWRGRCFCLCCLLRRKMYIVHCTQIGPTLSLISISPGYSLWQGWWTRGQHNIISYLLKLYIYFIFSHSGQLTKPFLAQSRGRHISFEYTIYHVVQLDILPRLTFSQAPSFQLDACQAVEGVALYFCEIWVGNITVEEVAVGQIIGG